MGHDLEAVATLTVLAWPGLDAASLLGDDYVIGRARRISGQASTLDAPDHRLARAGVMVELVDGTWTIRCGEYGSRSFPANGDGPPAEVLAAVSGLAREASLELAVRVRRAGRAFPVCAAAAGSTDDPGVEPEPVGRILDEDVSVLDGRRTVSRQRYFVVEGSHGLVAHARRRLGALGMVDRATETQQAPLGPPDPLPWPLDDEPDAAAIVQRTLARSVARLIAHDPVVRLDLHVEGVHQMRVAVRRLRSDLRTFDDLLGALPDGLLDDLRWLGGILGEVRDPDVLRDGLVEAIEHLDPVDRRATNSLVKRLVRERDAALDRLRSEMATPRYHALLQRLFELAEGPPLREEARERAAQVLRPRAKRAWRRLRRAAAVAGRSEATLEEVHAMRIRAKRFRYALDTLVDVEDAAKEQAQRLAVLQDVLGAVNDACVAEAWLRRVAAHEDDPRRMFVLGQLVMTQRALVEQRRAEWPAAWKPVARRRRRAWLDR